MEREWFGQVRWCEEDLINALECCDYPVTDNNIAKLYAICDKHWFVDVMIEAGWQYMYENIGYGDGWDTYDENEATAQHAAGSSHGPVSDAQHRSGSRN